MLLAAFYVFAILCIILYYTGHLKRWNTEWILIVLAVAVFPAVLYLSTGVVSTQIGRASCRERV